MTRVFSFDSETREMMCHTPKVLGADDLNSMLDPVMRIRWVYVCGDRQGIVCVGVCEGDDVPHTQGAGGRRPGQHGGPCHAHQVCVWGDGVCEG
jgi:hypothetical protein